MSRASKMLAEASTIQEAKEVKDLALTAADWARRKGLGEEAVQEARRYAMLAERKMGEMLLATERAKGATVKGVGKRGHRGVPRCKIPPTLSDLGISKRESAEAQQLAELPKARFDEIAAGKITLRKVQQETRQAERRAMAAQPVRGRFAVILADPPWQYDNSGFNQSAESMYPTMDLDSICDLAPMVNEWSTPHTVLFLWATNPLLREALGVMDAWGFNYKTNLAWIKDRGRGKGWFLKSKHELLLIGVRSETPQPKVRPNSAFEAARPSRHSQKPEMAYKLIEKMYDGQRLEMFSRNARTGWKAWGNEC